MPSMLAFNAKRGFYTTALPISDYINAHVYAAATNEDETVPAGAHFAILTGTVAFYVKRGGTAAVPAGDVSNGSGSQLCVVGTQLSIAVTPGDVLGIIAVSAGVVTVAYFGPSG